MESNLQWVFALQINLIGLKINSIAKLALMKHLSLMLKKTLVNPALKNISGINSFNNANSNVQMITIMRETQKNA